MIDDLSRSEAFRAQLNAGAHGDENNNRAPIVFLPLMRRPCAPVEKGHASYMRELLERTCAALRLEKPNG